jgi:hypothetical protein
MQRVSSSFIAAVGYDAETRHLRLRFHNGRTYDYHGVPERIYLGFIQASSKGSYFRRHIDRRY